MDEQKKYMNAKVVKNVSIKKIVAQKQKIIEQ